MLTEQFIGQLNDGGMIDEILKEVAILEDIEDTMSERVLLFTCRVEAQRAQKSVLNDIKETNESELKMHIQKNSLA